MTITLPLREEARLMAAAQAKGLSPEALVLEALDRFLAEAPAPPVKPKSRRMGCLPSTVLVPLRRRSTRIAGRCFAASARIFRDRRRCRYAYGLMLSAHVIEEAPFTADVVEALRQVPRAEVSDMPDRIVAATALYLRVPVITRDGRIRSSNIQTVW
jgi:predicted nucleic acid-binding protein